MHMPPLAHLPRCREVLHDVCGLLDRALVPARRFKRERADRQNDLLLVTSLHALNALQAAYAVHTLSGTDHASNVGLHFRTIFEALVKIKWMRADAARATAFLESEPFERYVLATKRVKDSPRWKAIVHECDAVIAGNTSLLDLPKASAGKNNPPNYKKIAKGLRMPDLSVMAASLGMDDDDLFIDHGVPSLAPHSSAIHLKNFGKVAYADGTFELSPEIEPEMLLNFVSRARCRTGEILNEILELIPDGAIMFESEKTAERIHDIVVALGCLMRSPNPL